MKKLLLPLAVLFFATTTFAQVLTTGRLSVDIQNYITRDSTDCSGALHYKLHCTVANSVVTDTVRFIDYYNGTVYEKDINTTGSSPFVFDARTNASNPKEDYDYYGGDAYFYFSRHLVICGTDSVIVPDSTYTRAWPNPCIYDTVEGRLFVDLDSDCLGAYVNAPAVNFLPLTSDTCYNGTIKQPVYNALGNGFYHLVLQKSFRTQCRISVPPILQFLYPNSNCMPPYYTFYDMPFDTVIYPFTASPMVNVVANAAVTNVVRPQMPFILHPVVYNMGYNPVGGKLYLVLDPHVVYNSSLSSNLPATVSGDTLMWNFTNLSATSNNGWWNSFFSSIHLTPDSTLAAGDSVCFTIFTGSIFNDVDTTDNRKSFCITLVSSYDPNIKQVTPEGEGPTGLIPATTKDLSYTVHFQNTGTASAINIFVLDTLDANVDSSSLQILTSTHNLKPEWIGNRVVKFNFAYINLPDSLHNEPKSHGSFSYKVNMKQGLVPGIQIKNTAAIYFDNNAPVLTNTTLNTIETPSAVQNTDVPLALNLYPNPTSGQVTVSLNKPINNGTLKLINLTGQTVILQNNVSGSFFTLNIANQPDGVYFLELNNGTYSQKARVVKQF